MKYINYQNSRERVTRVTTAEGRNRKEGSLKLEVCCRRIRILFREEEAKKK